MECEDSTFIRIIWFLLFHRSCKIITPVVVRWGSRSPSGWLLDVSSGGSTFSQPIPSLDMLLSKVLSTSSGEGYPADLDVLGDWLHFIWMSSWSWINVAFLLCVILTQRTSIAGSLCSNMFNFLKIKRKESDDLVTASSISTYLSLTSVICYDQRQLQFRRIS